MSVPANKSSRTIIQRLLSRVSRDLVQSPAYMRREEAMDQLAFGLPASLMAAALCTAVTQEAFHAPNPVVAVTLVAPVLLNSIDLIMVLSKPMTDAKAARTNLFKIGLASFVPGLQTACRIWGKDRKTNYKLLSNDKI